MKDDEVFDIAEKIVQKLGNAEQGTMTYSLVRNDVTHVRGYYCHLAAACTYVHYLPYATEARADQIHCWTLLQETQGLSLHHRQSD